MTPLPTLTPFKVIMRSMSIATLLLLALPGRAFAAVQEIGFSGPQLGPVPIEFVLFGLVLAGVAIFHHQTMKIAITGAIGIAIYKIIA